MHDASASAEMMAITVNSRYNESQGTTENHSLFRKVNVVEVLKICAKIVSAKIVSTDG